MIENEAKTVKDSFTRYTYVRIEQVYDVDLLTGKKADAPVEVREEQPKGEDVKFESLRAAIDGFLMAERYDAAKDGKVFYAKQDSLVYVGFARIEDDNKAHEHLAVFFRTDVEVTTTMKAHDVTLEEIEKVFE